MRESGMKNVFGSVGPPGLVLVLLLRGIIAAGAAASPAADPADAGSDVVIGAFEGADFGGWTSSGAAFQPGPCRPGRAGRFAKFEGEGIAWSGSGGAEARGTLLSPEFEIGRRFINYLIAGDRDLPSVIGVELLVDGRVVRSGSATEARGDNALQWRTWDVSAWRGLRGRIRVNDMAGYGALAVDHFVQSDRRKAVASDASVLMHETHRPQFHFTARSGWLNDANGLLHYRGEWHLFHQHRPPGSPVVVWGHAVSHDLLHWTHRPVAIPGEGECSIFSGSGLVDWENASGLKRGADAPLLFFYTLRPPGDTAVADGSGEKMTQCMAFSADGGRTFEKFAGNPILRTKDFRDRDPKVFWHAPSRAWMMVLSLSRNNANRDGATYGLFRSRDMRSWELLQEIGPGAWYWECPDMFEMPLDGDPGRMRWLLVKGSGDYIVGTFDGRAFRPETGPIRTQWGGSYYGAQTFSDAPEGRRIQIGWMNTGKAEAPGAYPGMPFNQQMSFPREWTLRSTPDGPRVFRWPIAEIENIRSKTHDMGGCILKPGENPLSGITHDLLEIELDLGPSEGESVILNLRGQEIRYRARERKLDAFGRTLALEPAGGGLSMVILLDRTSVEIFADRGAVTHAGAFFPDSGNHSLALTALGGSAHIERLVVHELQSTWPERAHP